MRTIKPKVTKDSRKSEDFAQKQASSIEMPVWETPKLEDVSEQVMAQPYIRFT
jgi:hypothetical protein